MNIALKRYDPIIELPQLNQTQILSSGIYLPKNIVKSEDLMTEIKSQTNYGIPENWISNKAGIIERRFADPSEKPSDLAIYASKQAINDSNINPREIDKIIYCGIDRDEVEPATAHTINDKLNLNASEVYDITDACFGFMRAIQDCERSIKLGEIKYALICTGETPSRLTRSLIDQMKKGVDKATFRKWIGFFTTGDAGGAIVLGKSNPETGNGFKSISTKVNSEHRHLCKYKWEKDGNASGQMLMGKLNAYGRRILQTFNEEVKNKDTYIEADYLLTHNTGSGSFEILRKLNLAPKENMPKLFSTLGNITSASLPVNFNYLDKEIGLKQGDRVGGIFSGSGLVFGHFDYLK